MNGRQPPTELVNAVEALLYVADEPVEMAEIARALELSVAAVRGLIDRLEEQTGERGLRVQRQGTRVQLVTAPEAGIYVRRFLGARAEQRLSPAALETLAIVAYQQPITRPALEAVRGVNCDHAIATLKARGLIEEVGRAESVGRPVLFGTTMSFLEHFGLSNPAELPPLPTPAET
ncbi:MAG: SMC-Scp complex subunit ScpB [Dehalococcoidia bacterium]